MKKILTYIFIAFITLAYSQKQKPSVKTDEIKTETKNLIRKGNKLYNQGKYVEAQNDYKEAIVLNPNYDKANYNYGNTQFLQNKMKEAKEQYELTSKTTKNAFITADSQHNLGNIAMKAKKYDAAVNAYKESLRNNPKDDETRYNLALAQKLLKDQQKKNDKNKDKNKDKKDDKKDKKDKKDDQNKDKKDKDKKDKDKKDKKNDQNKDKKDKDKKDKKDDQNKDKKDKKDDGKGKSDKDKKEQQQPKPQPSKLSPEQVKQMLEAMNKEENKTQKKMNSKKARGRKIKQDKDW